MRCMILRSLVSVAALTTTISAVEAQSTDSFAESVALGADIFSHNWARPESWTRAEQLGDGGDGLGPVFNAVSCAECHSQGGIGGAGGAEHNLQLVSVAIPDTATHPQIVGLLKRAKELHPHFTAQYPSVTLHQYAFGEHDELASYETWREEVASHIASVEEGQLRTGKVRPLPLKRTFRSTPALWGLGEIERLRIRDLDRTRSDIARIQGGSASGVTGRIPGTAEGEHGWYGWRGQFETLEDIVRHACANELGLHVARHPQAENPSAAQSSRRSPAAKDDLTESQVMALTRYIAMLPRPRQVLPESASAQEKVYEGERLFESIGCTECHTPSLGSVSEVYSDFLLHSMGRVLSDPAPAYPEPEPYETNRRKGYRRKSGLKGKSCLELQAERTGDLELLFKVRPPIRLHEPMRVDDLRDEWRTPPLWGVADSAPYLHDGRAATLEEAILLHAGEADPSREKFRYLSEEEKQAVILFLESLKAPEV